MALWLNYLVIVTLQSVHWQTILSSLQPRHYFAIEPTTHLWCHGGSGAWVFHPCPCKTLACGTCCSVDDPRSCSSGIDCRPNHRQGNRSSPSCCLYWPSLEPRFGLRCCCLWATLTSAFLNRYCERSCLASSWLPSPFSCTCPISCCQRDTYPLNQSRYPLPSPLCQHFK